MGAYATDEEAAAEADAAEAAAKAYTDEQLSAAKATDGEVSSMLNDVFGN